MPFGICSAPEIFQRKMHEIIEGMEGIEVVADDFLIYGCGKTTELANEDHDRKFRAFLEKCKINNLHLNKAKMIYKNTEVSYLGHRLSSEGIKPCEEKIKAIQQMPCPKDATGVRRILGMIQYLRNLYQH